MKTSTVLALLLCAATSAQANAPSDYAYVFPIETAQDGGSGAWRFDLTPAAYA